jgi:prevent-host-death family protein
MVMAWQLQEAKQRFSEVVRQAVDDGPQVVTRHGEEVAVVVGIDDFRRMSGERADLRDHLLSGPRSDDFEIPRLMDTGREIDLGW